MYPSSLQSQEVCGKFEGHSVGERAEDNNGKTKPKAKLPCLVDGDLGIFNW